MVPIVVFSVFIPAILFVCQVGIYLGVFVFGNVIYCALRPVRDNLVANRIDDILEEARLKFVNC